MSQEWEEVTREVQTGMEGWGAEAPTTGVKGTDDVPEDSEKSQEVKRLRKAAFWL